MTGFNLFYIQHPYISFKQQLYTTSIDHFRTRNAPLMEKEQELSNGHRYDIIDPEESRVYGMLCLERYTSTMSLNC